MDCLFQLCASYHTYCQSVVGEHGQEESLCKKCVTVFQRSITTFYHFGFNGYPYGTENITEEELSTAYYLNKNNLGEHKNPNAWNAQTTVPYKATRKIMVSGH